MKKILFPTEFAPHAPKLFQYALTLANAFEATIIIMNAIGPPLEPSDNPDFDEQGDQMADKFMAFKKAHQTPEFMHIKIVYVTEVGFAADAILRVAERKKVDFILMGTQGKSNAFDKYFGGASAAVLKKAKCWVLLIPPAANFDGFNNIACTTDFSFQDLFIFKALDKWREKFDAKSYCLHILKNDKDAEIVESKMQLLEDILADKKPDHFQTIPGKLENTIETFVKEKEIDLLVMLHHHRSFITHLIAGSTTKGLARNIPVPILVWNER